MSLWNSMRKFWDLGEGYLEDEAVHSMRPRAKLHRSCRKANEPLKGVADALAEREEHRPCHIDALRYIDALLWPHKH